MLKSNLIHTIEFGTAVTQRLKWTELCSHLSSFIFRENIFELYERAYGAKFRSGNLLGNGNKNR